MNLLLKYQPKRARTFFYVGLFFCSCFHLKSCLNLMSSFDPFYRTTICDDDVVEEAIVHKSIALTTRKRKPL